MKMLKWKQVYEAVDKEDGFRILIDRLWPRGLTKEKAALDNWAKEIAPSTELRQAFHKKELTEAEFTKKYRNELDHNPASDAFVEMIGKQLKSGPVTLVYASKDPEHSQLPVLRAFLGKKLEAKP